MRLRGTKFCTSSERFAPSFVRQHNGPKCTQMVQNSPKHEYRVQWGGSGAFVAKCSCHEVESEFFTTNAPDPTHWTLNSCFGVFHTIWVHLGLLSCLTKLRAKHSELVQKFMPQNCVESFATNAPDPPHWTLNSCFGVFRTIWVQLGQFGCLTNLGGKTGRTRAKVRATKSR